MFYSFGDAEIPDENDWSKAAVKVRLKVYNSLRELIKQWEVKKEIREGTIKRIQHAIETEFPSFEEQIEQIEKEMTGKSDTSRSHFDSTQEEEDYLVPDFIKNTFSGLGIGTKVVLGIGLSPLLLAGLVVRLPYVGIKALDRIWTKHKMEASFKAAANNPQEMKNVCEKYAEKTVKSITDKLSLRSIIEEDMYVLFKFLEAQRQRMQKQIKQDRELLSKLKLEECDEKDIEKIYQPLNAKCHVLVHQLSHFMLMYNPSFFPWLKQVNVSLRVLQTDSTETDKREKLEILCSGLIADIVVGDMVKTGSREEKRKVCVRREKSAVRYSDIMKYITALEEYRYCHI